VAYSLQVLAEIRLVQGQYEEAEALARRGLAMRSRIHGERHPTVSISLEILAKVRERQGDTVEALELYGRALAILNNTVGPDHPRVGEISKQSAAVAEGLERSLDAPVRPAARSKSARSVSRQLAV
jgi:tetratricopeptide (TPR) repeat protein